MLISSDQTQTTTNCGIVGQDFSIKASPVAFDILCSKLYTNPILAIVRELLTNAYDSHKLAGKEDTPIYVHLPTYMDSNFVIRDYGVGLSKEDVLSIYVSFFTSTKAGSNDFTGCFGLGSKTPFAYTSTFSIISYYNGIKYTFVATKKDGYPHIYPVNEEQTSEDNGLQITIPSNCDSDTFEPRFEMELRHFIKYIPEIKLKLARDNNYIATTTPLVINDKLKLYTDTKYTWQTCSHIIIKQGQNTYTTTNSVGLLNILLFNKSFNIVYEVPIGTLSIPPSREMLSIDNDNSKKLLPIEQEVEKKLREYLNSNLEELAACSNIFRRTLVEYRNELYFKLHTEYINTPFAYPRLCLNQEGVISATLQNTRNLLNNNVYIETNKPHVVITNYSDSPKISKIRKTILNYTEELNGYNVIVPSINTSDKKEYTRKVQELKNAIWLLNNNPSFTFNIVHMTLTQFFKKYPNSKQIKISTTKFPAIRIDACVLQEYMFNNGAKTTLEVCTIKMRSSCRNTFIVYKDKEKTYLKIKNFLRDCLRMFSSTETNISKELCSILQCNDNTVNLLFVSNSSRKHFKEYKELNLALLKTCCYNTAKHIVLSDIRREQASCMRNMQRLKNVIEGIDMRIKKIIQNSLAYKILTLVTNENKPNIDAEYIKNMKYNTSYTYQLRSLIEILPEYKEVFKKDIYSEYKSILVKKLEAIAEHNKKTIITKKLLQLAVRRKNVLF